MTHSSAVSAPTIADLWRTLRAWLADALRRGPAAVARLVTRQAQNAVARRLRMIESLLLKLLLVEAAQLHPFPGRGEAASPGPINADAGEQAAANAARRLHATVSMGPGLGAARQSGNGWVEDPANSKTWRVRFRPRLRGLLPKPPRPRAAPHARTVAAPPNPVLRARKLARRLEALRRVIAQPRRAVAALARRLHALGAAARAVAHAIALWRPRGAAPSLTLAHAIVHASDARVVFEDSS